MFILSYYFKSSCYASGTCHASGCNLICLFKPVFYFFSLLFILSLYLLTILKVLVTPVAHATYQAVIWYAFLNRFFLLFFILYLYFPTILKVLVTPVAHATYQAVIWYAFLNRFCSIFHLFFILCLYYLTILKVLCTPVAHATYQAVIWYAFLCMNIGPMISKLPILRNNYCATKLLFAIAILNFSLLILA